jgi:hypothetical protein
LLIASFRRIGPLRRRRLRRGSTICRGKFIGVPENFGFQPLLQSTTIADEGSMLNNEPMGGVSE